MKYILSILCASLLSISLPSQASYYLAYNAIIAKDGATLAADFVDAVNTNIRPGCQYDLAPIVAAIRYSENGGSGREYGILHPNCPPTYRGQAGWCAATVQKNYDRWIDEGKPGDFITFLGLRYCPPQSDPQGHVNWLANVNHYTSKFTPE